MLGLILGTLLVVAGGVVVASSYSEEYDCTFDLQCHDDDGTEPAVADRLATGFGFGLEAGPDSDLPGPEGTLLLAMGASLLLLVLIARPAREPEPPAAGHPDGDASSVRRPAATTEDPGPRQRIFLDR